MNDDRELLELAAKAVGQDIHDWNGDCPVYYIEHWSGDPNEQPQQEVCYWNPLTSDGDALRLAVKLGMSGVISLEQAETEIYPSLTGAITERHGDDPYAATRRAIVRAAAEIGKTA